MRQAKLRGWGNWEIYQLFKLASFHISPFLSLSPSHFSKPRASTHPPSAYYTSLFIVSAPAGQALCRIDSGSLSRHSHESFGPGVWLCPCGYAHVVMPPVASWQLRLLAHTAKHTISSIAMRHKALALCKPCTAEHVQICKTILISDRVFGPRRENDCHPRFLINKILVSATYHVLRCSTSK